MNANNDTKSEHSTSSLLICLFNDEYQLSSKSFAYKRPLPSVGCNFEVLGGVDGI